MGEKKRYKCLNCGNNFTVEVLTEEERREAERRGKPLYRITCPECGQPNVQEK